MSAYKWQFSPRFRRSAFGWRSETPIQRIKEALSEIRKVARKEPTLAAEGAVLFLEKISPALEHVDSSSGAIGGAVNHAIETLVPLIAKPAVADQERQQWLARLWTALEQDNMPYIEHLADFWGELCVTPVVASFWADQFLETVRHIWSADTNKCAYFKGTTVCLAALLAAERYHELLDLLDTARTKWWYDRQWGVKALVAMGKLEDALHYAENSRGINTPAIAIAQVCEDILLSMGSAEEAYERYALDSNQKTTNLATFRAITKKYPQKSPVTILHDLIESQPGSEGKWFAAAKDAGLFDLAIELISKHPADPRTLNRAAKDFATKNPAFAIASGLASLHWIIQGYGYEITGLDVLSAYTALEQAAKAVGFSEAELNEKIRALLSFENANTKFVGEVLMRYLNKNA